VIILIALIYGVVAVFFYYKYGAEWHLAFSAAFLTAGFVYLAGVVVLTSILFKTIKTNSISHLGVLKTGIFVSCILLLHSVASSHELNVLAIIQIVVLFFILANSKRVINLESMSAIAMGSLVGFVLVIANLLYTLSSEGIVLQDEFSYFSISGTFNYTGYYLVFGGILSPYLLRYSVRVRSLFFLLTLFSCFILENRSGFISGIFLFYTTNFYRKLFSIKSIILAVVPMVSGIYVLSKMNIINSRDQNDIIYSIINYEGNTSNVERLDMILTVFNQLENHPFGWGTDQSNHALKSYGFIHPHTHNTLTQWAVEYGYLGLFLFLFLTLLIFKLVWYGEMGTRKLTIALLLFVMFWFSLEAVQYNILVSIISLYFIFSMQFISRALPKNA